MVKSVISTQPVKVYDNVFGKFSINKEVSTVAINSTLDVKFSYFIMKNSVISFRAFMM